MMRELGVLARGRDFRPRRGVRVELRKGREIQSAVSDGAGLARFAVRDVATMTVVVDGVANEHRARMARPVRWIAIAQ